MAVVHAAVVHGQFLAGLDVAHGVVGAVAVVGCSPDLPPSILAAACTRYKALGIWGRTPLLPREGYDRLRDGLISGGFVSPGATFEMAVDNSLAETVVREVPT